MSGCLRNCRPDNPVYADGVVNYKGNRYLINTGMMDAHKRIRIEDDGEMLLFYDAETNDC